MTLHATYWHCALRTCKTLHVLTDWNQSEAAQFSSLRQQLPFVHLSDHPFSIIASPELGVTGMLRPIPAGWRRGYSLDKPPSFSSGRTETQTKFVTPTDTSETAVIPACLSLECGRKARCPGRTDADTGNHMQTPHEKKTGWNWNADDPAPAATSTCFNCLGSGLFSKWHTGGAIH